MFTFQKMKLTHLWIYSNHFIFHPHLERALTTFLPNRQLRTSTTCTKKSIIASSCFLISDESISSPPLLHIPTLQRPSIKKKKTLKFCRQLSTIQNSRKSILNQSAFFFQILTATSTKSKRARSLALNSVTSCCVFLIFCVKTECIYSFID